MPVGRRWRLLAASGRVRSVAAGNPHDVVAEICECGNVSERSVVSFTDAL